MDLDLDEMGLHHTVSGKHLNWAAANGKTHGHCAASGLGSHDCSGDHHGGGWCPESPNFQIFQNFVNGEY